MLVDLLVHHGLGETWLVKFIMPEPSISNYIYENILFEFHSIVHCHIHHLIYKLRLISIHMNNR